MPTHILVLQLGLVRFATSLLVVLLANVLNRVMIVDLAVPAAMVTFIFAFQHVMTPVGLVSGYCSDAYPLARRRRTPYIWGGMALSLVVMPFFPAWAETLGGAPHYPLLWYQGLLLFSLFGIGTTVSATAINALLVDRIPEPDRGAALTLLWILTLMGFIVGSIFISHLLPNYEPQKMQQVFLLVPLLALLLTGLGLRKAEPHQALDIPDRPRQLDFRHTLQFLGSNRQTLTFFAFLLGTIFFWAIQTFILTAFGGEVLALPVAQTSKFGVYISYGILAGMSGLHLWLSRSPVSDGKGILILSLLLGALAFGLLSLAAFRADTLWGLYALIFFGLARGCYNVGISHLTMGLAHPAFSGVFMGLWNLISGLALAAGEMTGGLLRDQMLAITGTPQGAYGLVFLLEGLGLVACLALLKSLKREQYQLNLAVLLANHRC